MARSFSIATHSYLELSSGAPVTAMPMTFAAWFYTTDVTLSQSIVSIGLGTSADTFFQLSYRGDVVGKPVIAHIRDGNVGSSSANSTTGVTNTNEWHHGVAVFASTTDRRVYLDGGGKNTDPTNVNPTGVTVARIGRVGITQVDETFQGRIAEVGIWNVALTDEEAAALAAGAPPTRVRPGSLVRYAPLWGFESPEPDLGGNADTWSLNNGPTTADHAPIGMVGVLDSGEGQIATVSAPMFRGV